MSYKNHAVCKVFFLRMVFQIPLALTNSNFYSVINQIRGFMERRRIIQTKYEHCSPYNRYGSVSNGLKWMPLSKDKRLEHEVFIVKFEPESSSSLHKHKGYEEFYVIDGELIDDDGKVFKKGDYIKFEKGTKHSSHSKNGCTLLVILYAGTNELSV